MKLPTAYSLRPTALSERDRRALNALVAAACLLLLARFVAFPLWDALAVPQGGTIPVREKTLRKYRALAQVVPARENDFGALKARLEQAEAGLLQNKTGPLAAAEVQQTVRDMVAASGIQVRGGDFLPLHKLDEQYAAVPVSAQFTASMDQLVNLLKALRSAPRTLAVEQWQISAANVPDKKQVNVYLVVAGVVRAEALAPQLTEDSRR